MDNNDFKTDIEPVVIAETLDEWEVTDLRVDEKGFHFMHRGREAHIRLLWTVEIDEQDSADLEHGESYGVPQSPADVLNELLHRYRHPPMSILPVTTDVQPISTIA